MVQPILAPTRPDWDKPNVPTPAEWEKVKEIFTKYYLNIDNTYGQLTLNEIRKIMAENHQFNANEAQYKNKISKWKLGRNLDKNTVKNLARIQDKRAQSGGEKTAFKFHGIPVSEDKLERSRKRLGLAQPVATDPELSVTPPTISYSTPTLQSDFTMDDVSAEVDVPGVNGITVAINDIATGIHEISAATHEISAAINEIAAAANDELFNSNSVDIDGLDEKISSEIIFVEEPIMFSNDPIITSDPINMDIICIDSEKEHFSVVIYTPHGSCERLSHLKFIEFSLWNFPGARPPMSFEVIGLRKKQKYTRVGLSRIQTYIQESDGYMYLRTISFRPCIPGAWNKCISEIFHNLQLGDTQGLTKARGRVSALFKHERSILPSSLGSHEFRPTVSRNRELYLPVPVHAVLAIELPGPLYHLSWLQFFSPSSELDPFHPRKNFLKDNNKKSSMRGSVWMSSGWGGESVIGSWIKDDVIMSGRSPFGSDSHSVCSRENLEKHN